MALIALAVGSVQADIYKCTDADGNLSYLQTPCPQQQAEVVMSTAESMDEEKPDCGYANRFAFASARLMQAGMTSSALFDRYGGLDALSKSSINIINYVYGHRTNGQITAERIATLAETRCEARSFGNVSCEALPRTFTDRFGGCDQAQSTDTGEAADVTADIRPAESQSAGTTRRSAAATQNRSPEEVEQCKQQYRDAIDAIDAEMRRGYTSEQGEVYRERLRGLTQQMRKC